MLNLLLVLLLPVEAQQSNGMCYLKNRFKVINGISIPLELVKNVNKALDFAVPKVKLTSKGFRPDCLNAHNQYRALLGKRPLVWSSQTEGVAQKWANRLAKLDRFEHSHTPGYGENLYQVRGGDPSCNAAVKAWFNEYDLYPAGTPIGQGDFEAYGHYTQLIWDATISVGCAQSIGRNVVTVCNYLPPGNVIGTRLYPKIPT
jgi:hypothetical protein